MRYTKSSCVLVTIAFVLACIGTTQPLFGFETTDASGAPVHTDVSLWATCVTALTQGVTSTNCTSLDKDGCGPFTARVQGGRAFAVLSDVLLGLLFLAVFTRTVVEFHARHLIHTACLVLAGLGTVSALIAFPLLISVYSTDFECKGGITFSPRTFAGVGMGGMMMAVAFTSVLAALILDVFVRFCEGSEGDAKEGHYASVS